MRRTPTCRGQYVVRLRETETSFKSWQHIFEASAETQASLLAQEYGVAVQRPSRKVWLIDAREKMPSGSTHSEGTNE